MVILNAWPSLSCCNIHLDVAKLCRGQGGFAGSWRYFHSAYSLMKIQWSLPGGCICIVMLLSLRDGARASEPFYWFADSLPEEKPRSATLSQSRSLNPSFPLLANGQSVIPSVLVWPSCGTPSCSFLDRIRQDFPICSVTLHSSPILTRRTAPRGATWAANAG